MCYPVCGMMHIKEPLLLIKKSSPCGGSRFPLSLSEWSFTIYLMPYTLNKTFCVHHKIKCFLPSTHCGLSDQSFMMDPLSYFSFLPVLHNWCDKCHSRCYPVSGMVHIKNMASNLKRIADVVATAWFFSRYLNGPLPYS